MRRYNTKLYFALSSLFWFIRQFVIPNPFEPLAPGIPIELFGASILLTPDILNWIAGLYIPGASFALAGLFYQRGDGEPAVGSILYMLFFWAHTGILELMSSVYPNLWFVGGIAVLYVLCVIGLIVLACDNRM